MTRRYIAIVTLLLIAAAVVVALHERQSVPLPEVPAVAPVAEVRVKAVERKGETIAGGEGTDLIATVNCHRYAKQSSAELIAEGRGRRVRAC